jgi:antitoxin (DNA-binding transcriptional repressor) of toxin-antitoxin stability system
MKIFNDYAGKTKLLVLLAEVEITAGTARICLPGKPVADVVPHSKRRRLGEHPLMRRIRLNHDPLAPLAAHEWQANNQECCMPARHFG